MPTELNRRAFARLIAEDAAWLMNQPPSLERDHIASLLREAVLVYYSFGTEIKILKLLAAHAARWFTVAEVAERIRPAEPRDSIKIALEYLADSELIARANDGNRGMIYTAREDEEGEGELDDQAIRDEVLRILRAEPDRWFYFHEISAACRERFGGLNGYHLRAVVDGMVAANEVESLNRAAFRLSRPQRPQEGAQEAAGAQEASEAAQPLPAPPAAPGDARCGFCDKPMPCTCADPLTPAQREDANRADDEARNRVD